MQNWTTEMWQAGLAGLIIGFLLGYFIVRISKGNVKKQLKTESELAQLKTQLNNQKQQLETHFSQSAELLKTLAQDYQKLYQHLATSSSQLLPELSDKTLFSSNLLTENQQAEHKTEDDQPRDYSEGSSGILKAEK